MSVRQLRRFLLNKGVSAANLAKLIDKKDLRSLAESYVFYDNSYIVGLFSFYIVSVMTCIFLLFYSRHIVVRICAMFNSWLYSFIYPTILLMPSIKYAFRKSLIWAVITLSLCCLLDIYQGYVQLSILLSWILPQYSILNRFLAPTLHFPVSPSSLTPAVSGSYSFDIGPMISLWICTTIKSRLKTWGVNTIMESKHA